MCRFPAAELLRMRRQLAAQADRSCDAAFVHSVLQFIKATDCLRLAHFELCDCLCWQDAAERLDARASRIEAA